MSNQIKAKIIADSVNPAGDRLTTFELEYPRFIHSEFMTHRMFSRNAASSRAIPIWNTIKQVIFNPAMPTHWGKHKKGMQADGEVNAVSKFLSNFIWRFTGIVVAMFAGILKLLGIHKQVANRMMEPWVLIKVLVSSTDYSNFFELRAHPDAQPEIQELAYTMKYLYENNTPQKLKIGEWHVPYSSDKNDPLLSLFERLIVSVSCSAQVSFRRNNTSIDTAKRIVNKLYCAKPFHASPFEHQAKAVKIGDTKGNFKNFEQLRHNMKEFETLSKGVFDES